MYGFRCMRLAVLMPIAMQLRLGPSILSVLKLKKEKKRWCLSVLQFRARPRRFASMYIVHAID
jgi:hypothetical protein